MSEQANVRVFFNFRSPYCYLVSKRMFRLFDNFQANLVWRPLGGWQGRSAPDRAKVKIPGTRQDVARIGRKMGLPVNPPPIDTDPTAAGAGSLLAEEKGLLRQYVVMMMWTEWAEGENIGDLDVLLKVGEKIGLDRDELAAAASDKARLKQLDANWEEAQASHVIGVPTFVYEDQVFWGNDRLEYLEDIFREKGLVRPEASTLP
ncbi:MAG: DsbA family protein [Alphaproteobacteria bacterium]